MTKKYQHVALGGTFDHFHAGHIKILNYAFNIGEKVTIGITDDQFPNQKEFSSEIQPFTIRKNELEKYLNERHIAQSAQLIVLTDPYGPATSNPSFDAIVVTPDTIANAKRINEVRRSKGLSPLEIELVELKKGIDDETISSTRIRAGSTNRDGDPYLRLFQKNLTLPDSLRMSLQAPIGMLISGQEEDLGVAGKKLKSLLEKRKPVMTIAVGDIVTRTFSKLAIPADIAIIDYITRRDIDIKHDHIVGKIELYKNPPGTIQRRLSQEIYRMIQKKTQAHPIRPEILHIDGEEDLLALPAILAAPLGSYVVYGIRDRGICVVEVTEEVKTHISALIARFE